MTSKIMEGIKRPFLWFPDSYGLGFANEHAEHWKYTRTRSCGTPTLRHAQGPPHQTLALAQQ